MKHVKILRKLGVKIKKRMIVNRIFCLFIECLIYLKEFVLSGLPFVAVAFG